MVKSASRTARPASRGKSRKWLWMLILVALALGATAWFYRAPVTGTAGAGTAYAARVACSCRFVGNRSLKDCGKDKLSGMELITLKEDTEKKSVTARFPLIASETATFKEGYGCVLEKWED